MKSPFGESGIPDARMFLTVNSKPCSIIILLYPSCVNYCKRHTWLFGNDRPVSCMYANLARVTFSPPSPPSCRLGYCSRQGNRWNVTTAADLSSYDGMTESKKKLGHRDIERYLLDQAQWSLRVSVFLFARPRSTLSLHRNWRCLPLLTILLLDRTTQRIRSRWYRNQWITTL